MRLFYFGGSVQDSSGSEKLKPRIQFTSENEHWNPERSLMNPFCDRIFVRLRTTET